jgi:hypothetical protein
MRKLKLDVESLAVQTFETASDAGSRGTVKAHDSWATTGGPGLCPAACVGTDSNPSCAVGDTCWDWYC